MVKMLVVKNLQIADFYEMYFCIFKYVFMDSQIVFRLPLQRNLVLEHNLLLCPHTFRRRYSNRPPHMIVFLQDSFY